jgi:hypothetical protein
MLVKRLELSVVYKIIFNFIVKVQVKAITGS